MELAGLGRRFVALVIDWIIAALTVSGIAGVSYPPDDIAQNLIITAAYIVEVGLLVGLLGVSIGKRLMGIRVEDPDGRPPGVVRGLLRTALICAFIPPLVQNPEGRGLHDVLANTRQVPIRR